MTTLDKNNMRREAGALGPYLLLTGRPRLGAGTCTVTVRVRKWVV